MKYTVLKHLNWWHSVSTVLPTLNGNPVSLEQAPQPLQPSRFSTFALSGLDSGGFWLEGVRWYVVFCVVESLRFILAGQRRSLLRLSDTAQCAWTTFVSASLEGLPGCFHILAAVNSAAVNFCIEIFV